MKICSGPPYELIPIRKYSTKIRQFGSQLQIAGLLSTCTRMPPPNLPIPMCSLHLANLLPALPSGFAQQLHQQPPNLEPLPILGPSNLGNLQPIPALEGLRVRVASCGCRIAGPRLERFQGGWKGSKVGGFQHWRLPRLETL
jgi:hypothetical protein